MARRLLVGAAAALLGVATAEFVFTYTMARIARRRHLQRGERLFPTVRIDLVDATRALLSVALLRAPPLSGERLRAAERGVARALADGATDLRLLFALLAARDGRFDEALRLYGEAAREDPSDLRPKALGHLLCHLTGRPVVAPLRWEGSRHLLEVEENAQLLALLDELAVAAALGGARYGIMPEEEGGSFLPESNRVVLRCAAGRAGVGLAAAMRDEEMPPAKRMKLAALRAFLRVSVESVLNPTVSKFVVKFAKPKPKEGEDSDKE